jgi:3-oxoadipate enol-lactonase
MGASLHHVEAGRADAPVVVLSPSLGTTVAMWGPQVPPLADRFRVVAVDHRGHGGSEVVPGSATVDDLGGDVLALLDGLRIDRVSWAGVSLGGMVGMWLAAHAPERVERLALVCTAAYLPPARAWRERAATVRRDRGTAGIADAVIGRWFTAAFARREPVIAAAHRAMLLGTPAEGYAACCEAIAGMDLRPDLPAVTAPTLVIAGADDPATPPAYADEIAGAIPTARVAVVPEGAHLASVEQPDLVTKLLMDHLDGS